MPRPPISPRLRSLTDHPAGQALRRALSGYLLAVYRRTRTVWSTVRRAFRRSLQLRVVGITLLLSTVLVAVFGVIIASTINTGLLEAKQKQAYARVVSGGLKSAQELAQFRQADDPSLKSTVTTLLGQLADKSEQDGVQVVLIPPDPSVDSQARPDASATTVVQSPELQPLRQRVLSSGRIVRQPVTVDPAGTGPAPYLAFGQAIRTGGGDFQLYYLFPLTDEVAAANLVQTTVVVTGFILVTLLAGVAALVTRLVVRPVRIAARTAQRLSAGLLDQRMQVRGEDDLALLATSFNQMAANLQNQIVRLEEMSRLQRRFTSDVSHELRTPLTTVRMAADLIFAEREEFDPLVARSAELLQAELDRFEGLLTDLLEISRFDAGFALLDAEPTDLVPIVRRVVDRLEALADQAGCGIEVVVPREAVIAEIDPRRVERVLRNLVGNAVEHCEGRPVRVELAATARAIAVTVRDHGVGLKPGEEKLVFNRFWRADPSRARQTGGTGLGLSISLEDARLHGGWLEAWGAPGEGAQFRLTLPARAGDRLTGSPLPLVPADAPTPGAVAAGVPAASPAALPAALTAPAGSPVALTGPEHGNG